MVGSPSQQHALAWINPRGAGGERPVVMGAGGSTRDCTACQHAPEGVDSLTAF
jgi:hypothetical protein